MMRGQIFSTFCGYSLTSGAAAAYTADRAACGIA